MSVVPEADLGQRFASALKRAREFFMADSPLQNAAQDIAGRLSDLGIDYALLTR